MQFLPAVERKTYSINTKSSASDTAKFSHHVYPQDVCEQPCFSESPDDYNHRFWGVRMDEPTAGTHPRSLRTERSCVNTLSGSVPRGS